MDIFLKYKVTLEAYFCLYRNLKGKIVNYSKNTIELPMLISIK